MHSHDLFQLLFPWAFPTMLRDRRELVQVGRYCACRGDLQCEYVPGGDAVECECCSPVLLRMVIGVPLKMLPGDVVEFYNLCWSLANTRRNRSSSAVSFSLHRRLYRSSLHRRTPRHILRSCHRRISYVYLDDGHVLARAAVFVASCQLVAESVEQVVPEVLLAVGEDARDPGSYPTPRASVLCLAASAWLISTCPSFQR
jgi:hypothetical protein